MVLKSADQTPLSSGWTTPDFFADTLTSPKPINTTTTPPPTVYIDIQALIMNNCSLLYTGPLTLATSHRDNTWTAHVTGVSRVLLSASAPDIHSVLDALHRKSAEVVASRLPASPPNAELESWFEDGNDDDYEEEEVEHIRSWEQTPEPCPIRGRGPLTLLLPVRRPSPPRRSPSRFVPPPPRPATSPSPPPAIESNWPAA